MAAYRKKSNAAQQVHKLQTTFEQLILLAGNDTVKSQKEAPPKFETQRHKVKSCHTSVENHKGIQKTTYHEEVQVHEELRYEVAECRSSSSSTSNTKDSLLPSTDGMTIVELPTTVSHYDKNLGDKKNKNINHQPLGMRKIVHYSGTALQKGRPLNKVMIMLAGESGSGKTVAMRKLFCNSIPDTTDRRPKTTAITEYTKELCVDDESSQIKGSMSFVDTPGFLVNTNQREADIVKFREDSDDIAKRQRGCKGRKQVYPNLVLFTVQAGPSLMRGQKDKLLLNLRSLERCCIVDEHNVNVIVVVTHASNLGTTKKSYDFNKRKIANIVGQSVLNILNIHDVKIAFVENKPTLKCVKQKCASDVSASNIYVSNYELKKLALEQFEANNDHLGFLFWEWYFDGSERHVEPSVSHRMSVIDLPHSLRDFYNMFNAPQKASSCPIKMQKVISYCKCALETGRPLNKVMIVMAGQSGAGKSETINVLFNEKLCATSANTSETREVKEYGKELCVHAESPPVKGILSMVDVPGYNDVIQSKEVINQALIRKFREQNTDLSCREGLFTKMYKIRQNVYPNAILLTVKATDNRLVGPNSNLQQGLELLKASRMVDPEYTNLIIVVTHAMSIPCKIYSQTCSEKRGVIRKVVFDALHIRNTPVVFVENCAADHNLKMEEGVDFYRLPDGELSHFNLFQVIITVFKRNNDLLGRLLCGWYFADHCPEKKQAASVIKSLEHETITNYQVKEAAETLKKVRFVLPATEGTLSPFLFHYLGRGYCPRNETTKNVSMCPGKDTMQVFIGDKSYSIPKEVLVFHKTEASFKRRSKETKKDYEASRVRGYGIEADILIVNVTSKGRWVKDHVSNDAESELSMLYEMCLASLTLDEPEIHTKLELLDAIEHLPLYNENSTELYHEFFRKWGSHFICEVNMGGYIKVDTSVEISAYTEKVSVETLNRMKLAVKGINSWLPHGIDGEYNTPRVTSQHQDKHDTQVTVCGGDPPSVITLEELTPELVSEWEKSIRNDPTESKYSFKLKPYYDLLRGSQRTKLKSATQDYLQSDLKDKKHTRDEASRITTDDVKQEVNFNSASCFPASAKVNTTKGLISIHSLKCGDVVLTLRNRTVSTKTAEFYATEFCSYLHFDTNVMAEFLVFHLQNGKTLTVTGEHLLFCYVNKCMQPVQANRVGIGSKLACVNIADNSKVISTVEPTNVVFISKTIMQGVFSPLTLDGTFVVDGVLVSCYACVDSHTVAHASMAPLRWWHNTWKALISFYSKTSSKVMAPRSSGIVLRSQTTPRIFGIHSYAKLLISLNNLLPFKFVQQ